MDMPEVEDMNILVEHDHPSNHRLGEEDMNTKGIHMVEVEGMDIVEECPSNHWQEDESMDMKDIDMIEDMPAEVVEREHKDMVLARH
jgi:hypothetical protein